MKLHEIEFYSEKPDEVKELNAALGLNLLVDEQNLKVFDSGIAGLDLNVSTHYPANKISLSFIVKDIDAFVNSAANKNIILSDVFDSHLGLKAVTLVNVDSCRVVVHSPTDTSPDWLRKMV
jgi:hypothetical protein